MIIVKYNNGKIETMSNAISPIWFASKLEKNGGIDECYGVVLDATFIEDNFEQLKPIINKYKIKQEK